MPNWPMNLLVVCVIVLASCANGTGNQPIALLDGKPLLGIAVTADTHVSFDGKDDLLIRNAGGSFRLSARSPSLLLFSPSRTAVVLNFGNGSGQVYDIAVYDLSDGSEFDLRQFRSSVMKHAKEHGCMVNPDVASIVFKEWVSERQIRVATEDFSREASCSVLNKDWIIDLRPAKGN